MMDDLTKQRGELIALFREDILTKEELKEQLASIAIQIRQLESAARPPAGPPPAARTARAAPKLPHVGVERTVVIAPKTPPKRKPPPPPPRDPVGEPPNPRVVGQSPTVAQRRETGFSVADVLLE